MRDNAVEWTYLRNYGITVTYIRYYLSLPRILVVVVMAIPYYVSRQWDFILEIMVLTKHTFISEIKVLTSPYPEIRVLRVPYL